jgi:hypothetical protein
MHLTVDGLQRPQCEKSFELPPRRTLQQEHQDIDGDQYYNGGNFHASHIF